MCAKPLGGTTAVRLQDTEEKKCVYLQTVYISVRKIDQGECGGGLLSRVGEIHRSVNSPRRARVHGCIGSINRENGGALSHHDTVACSLL